MENRLELIVPKLSVRLKRAADVQLRSITLDIVEKAISNAKVENPIVVDYPDILRRGGPYGQIDKQEIQSLVEELDRHYFDLQDIFGGHSTAVVLSAFSRARAVNALLFALDPDPLNAALESLYESHASIGDVASIDAVVTSQLGT